MPVFVSPLAYRFLLVALLLHSMPVVCETPLHNFSATYSVRSGGLKIGKMQRRLTIAPENHYRFESKIESTGLIALVHGSSIEETSEGDLIAGQIRPRHYAYRRVTKDKRKESTITFDWEHSRISSIAKGEPSDMTASPGALDKLVYQLALMQDLVRGDGPLRYAVADDGQLKVYEFSRAGSETVEIGGQAVTALKVIYARKGTARKTTLWCAPDYAYLPIKIEYVEADGRPTTATLTTFQ